MQIVDTDKVNAVQGEPNYNANNPLVKLMGVIERVELAAEREFYVADGLEYLFPFDYLELYGPQGDNSGVLNPRHQNSKTDFQKQNISHFRLTDVHVIRGWASAGDWTGPFLRVSYRGGPDSVLSQAAGGLGHKVKMWIKVGNQATPSLIELPYNETSDRYEVEMWGDPGFPLRDALDDKGKASFDRGELTVRNDLILGSRDDFQRENLNGVKIWQRATDHTMHPMLPLHIEVAFANEAETVWDSNFGANHHYEFSMSFRGWNHFIETGVSPNPHGGVGFLEYRNLFSNYKGGNGPDELGRELNDWNLDSHGSKAPGKRYESFMAVDYMDLHILKPTCGIGIHRHRDNQEVFLMMQGKGYMVEGDWCQMPHRERAFEVRTLTTGSLALCKTGQLHGLFNSTDEDTWLFMFGGYD